MREVSFNLEAVTLDKANQKALHPDKDGVYKGLVLMVIGKPSRNGKIYEVESMTRAITDPNSCFYKKLVAGQAYGEICHPLIFSDNELSRIATIDMTKVSHVVLRTYTGPTTAQGHTIVYGDIKPTGPYKDMLIESLESNVLNTAFSLRSLVEKIGTDSDGNIVQRVQALVAIDSCDCPGYAAASKVHSASDEGLCIPLHADKNQALLKTLVSQEVISDHQLEDLLGVDSVRIMHNSFNVDNGDILREGRKASLFHTMFNH